MTFWWVCWFTNMQYAIVFRLLFCRIATGLLCLLMIVSNNRLLLLSVGCCFCGCWGFFLFGLCCVSLIIVFEMSLLGLLARAVQGMCCFSRSLWVWRAIAECSQDCLFCWLLNLGTMAIGLNDVSLLVLSRGSGYWTGHWMCFMVCFMVCYLEGP